MENFPSQPQRPYFVGIPGLWRFRCRPDLVEELDFGEAFIQSLPASKRHDVSWIRARSLVESDFHWEKMREVAARGYRPISR